MVCLIGILFVSESNRVVGIHFGNCVIVFVFVIVKFISGCISSGFFANINDICGHYAGIVFGISNTIATISGIISPFIVTELTKNVNF